MSRQRTDPHEKRPPEVMSEQVPQGGPASIQIYTKSGLRKPFPSRWPREAPPACKSIRKLVSRSHFPRGGPASVQIYTKSGLRKPFPSRWPGSSRQRANLYEKWPPEAISKQVTQGGPASMQIYTKSGLRKPFPSRWPGCAQGASLATNPYRWTLCGNLQGMRRDPH